MAHARKPIYARLDGAVPLSHTAGSAQRKHEAEFALDAYDFPFSENLVAEAPAEPRDASRLLVLDRKTGAIEHARFRDLPKFLRPGDCLVLNRTKVLPARMVGRKTTGGKVELLLLREVEPGLWTALSSDVKPGAELRFTDNDAQSDGAGKRTSGRQAGAEDDASIHNAGALIESLNDDGEWLCRFSTEDVRGLMELRGLPPLPPYILKKRRRSAAAAHRSNLARRAGARIPAVTSFHRSTGSPADNASMLANEGSIFSSTPADHRSEDRERYQTVYASEEGSVAAPTAGLHFTPQLLNSLRSLGVRTAELTLHVGRGTFQPIAAEDIREHAMKSEWYRIPPETAAALADCRRAGGRIVTVGTTATRTIETFARTEAAEGWTNLFLRPGHEFKAVDALMTNFHQPRSTPLVLACAFAGRDKLLPAYREAVAAGYRLYSFGDAMLIL